MADSSSSRSPGAFWRAVFIGGIIAGSVDVGAAAVINHVGPTVVLHAIARGLLGKSAMAGGMATAAAGLGLQLTMSVLIAAIYGFACRRARLEAKLWPIWGLLAGGVIFVVMEFGVVPLSAYHHAPRFTATALLENLVAMAIFGLIVAFCLQGYPLRRSVLRVGEA
jgi:hypothetical protein